MNINDIRRKLITINAHVQAGIRMMMYKCLQRIRFTECIANIGYVEIQRDEIVDLKRLINDVPINYLFKFTIIHIYLS